MNEILCLTIFSIILSALSLEIPGDNETIVANNFASPGENPNSTQTSEEEVCTRVDSCRGFELAPGPPYNDLRKRKCMCDEKCAMYGDCCVDSSYQKETYSTAAEFVCTYTPYDGFIYKLGKCPSNYTDDKITYYCETNDATTLLRDVALIIPVVNEAKNLTYKNVFCAFCNNDTAVKFWGVVLHYDLLPQHNDEVILSNSSIADDKSEYAVDVDGSLLLDNLKVDEKHATLASEFRNSTYKCEIGANMPNAFSSSARYCRPQIPPCTECQKINCTNVTIAGNSNILLVDLSDSRLPRTNHCDHLPKATNVDFEKYLCIISANSEAKPEKKEGDIESCFFQTTDGKLCLINSYYEVKTEFEYRQNNTIYVFAFKGEFGDGEWEVSSTGNHSVYVCGTYIPMSEEEKWYIGLNNLLTEILIKFSIFFLVVFLIVSSNKKKMQSLPNKIIFSYCLTLLALYILFEVAPILPDCKIAAAVTHYLFLSCFAWLLIAAYDFWLVICRSSSKLQTLAGKARLKRYLVYAFFGWISPLSILSVAVYFELAAKSTIQCTYKPGYGRLAQCFIAQQTAAYWFFYYPSFVIFCIIITLFAHTSYHIYQSKRKNIKSTAQNNYYMLFAKLAMTMGLTWTLGMLVTYTPVLVFRPIYVILNASQGTFMFFAYGFKKEMLSKIYKMPKESSVIQRTKSTFVSLTDRIHVGNRPSQSTSADPPTQESESISNMQRAQ